MQIGETVVPKSASNYEHPKPFNYNSPWHAQHREMEGGRVIEQAIVAYQITKLHEGSAATVQVVSQSTSNAYTPGLAIVNLDEWQTGDLTSYRPVLSDSKVETRLGWSAE